MSVARPAWGTDDGNFKHNLWALAQYSRVSFASQTNDYGDVSVSGEQFRLGALYTNRLLGDTSFGLGLTFYRFIRVANSESANATSIPMIVSFDPRIYRELRLLVNAGPGLQVMWGHDGNGRVYVASGVELLLDLAIAIEVQPKLAILATAGLRYSTSKIVDGAHQSTSRDTPSLIAFAIPVGIGLRYSL